MLCGTVEVDETWVGPRDRRPGDPDLWQENKAPVDALIVRGGNMQPRVYGEVTKDNLREAIDSTVKKDAVIMTDEYPAYRDIAGDYAGHETVNHSADEYVRGNAHVNTCESFFALLKRGIHGTFPHCGKQHLHRHADEFAYRWNYRKVSDAERTEAALRQAPGKRLV